MKIIVKYEASQTETHYTWDLDDLGYTEEEWNNLSEDEQKEALEEGLSDTPYWVATKIEVQ